VELCDILKIKKGSLYDESLLHHSFLFFQVLVALDGRVNVKVNWVCRKLIMVYFEMCSWRSSLEQSQEVGQEDGARRSKGQITYNVKLKLSLSTT
jgi:hypothetical protein